MHNVRLPRTHNLKGFTLIEILIVIVVISISIAVVVVNISTGGPEKKAEQEVLRMQQLLRFAHQQSVIRAQDYGVRFYRIGYRFMQYDNETEQWADVQRDRLLRSRILEEPLELNLYIEQLSVDIPNSTDDDPEIEALPEEPERPVDTLLKTTPKPRLAINNVDAEKVIPQIFLLSSGELTPAFELHIRVPGTDIEEILQGLPQGEYTRAQNTY